MKAKHKLTLVAAGTLLALAAGSAATAAERGARGPFDAKAREIFEKVISIPTSLGNRKVPEMAAYLAGEFRAAGFPAEDVTIVPFKLPDDETAALVVRYRGDGSGGKPILLLAHMDVVTAKASDWVRDPYKLVEENGFFYGRGTYDVKHGITELTTLFLRLKAEKYVPKRDLIIYFSGDEETSMATTVAVANKHRQLIDAEYALNSDGGGGTLDDDTGKPLFFGLQTAEKTYADFSLTTRNAGGHSSTPRADNAIYDLAAALVKLRQFSFPVMWNDTTVANFRAAAKTTPGELGAAMAKFAANPKDEAAAATLAANPSYVGQTRTTCVATMLEGGHAQNALPQSAAANVNCRIFPGVKIEDVRLALAGVVGEGVEVKVDGDADVERRLAAAQRHRRGGDPRRAQVLSGGDHRAPAGFGRHRRSRVPLGRNTDVRSGSDLHPRQGCVCARARRAPAGEVVLRRSRDVVPAREGPGRHREEEVIFR